MLVCLCCIYNTLKWLSYWISYKSRYNIRVLHTLMSSAGTPCLQPRTPFNPPGPSAPIPGPPHQSSLCSLLFGHGHTVQPGLSLSPGRCPLSQDGAALALCGCPAPGWGRDGPWLPGPASPDLLGIPNILHTPTPGSHQPLQSSVNRQ